MKTLDRLSLIRAGGTLKSERPMTRVPSVSVVIPCYNYGHCLRQCVESVTRDQTGIEIEVIVVDDKSTDNSLDIACSLQAEDPRIRIISHEINKGHIQSFNDGLDAATGEFVLLLSADDLVTPGALTRAAALLMAESSVGMVYGNVIDFDTHPPPARTGEALWVVWRGSDWLRDRCRSGYNVVSGPSAVMRTSVLRAIGGYRPDLPHAGDFEMWMRTAAVSDIGFLAGVDQGYYRHHAVNMHKSMFHSGTAHGQLIDIKQRWLSFEAVFTGIGRMLPEAEQLFATARQTIACQALEYANYAYARGFLTFPVESFEQFACHIYPGVGRTRTGRALERRKRFGMISLPLHPLWTPSAVAWRSTEAMRAWRRRRIGV